VIGEDDLYEPNTVISPITVDPFGLPSIILGPHPPAQPEDEKFAWRPEIQEQHPDDPHLHDETRVGLRGLIELLDLGRWAELLFSSGRSFRTAEDIQ
jgi:hypothetical protein